MSAAPGLPWVVVRLRKQAFALPTTHLRELVVADEIRPVARSPAHVRGLVNLRGHVMPVIDLRVSLGLPSVPSEVNAFCELMVQREEDHRKWMAELIASVHERRPFGLTTDPHRCAFGRWYDSYTPEDSWVAALLKKFDLPHQRIHRLGTQVEALKASGRHAEALALIEQSRANGLELMVELFAQLREVARQAARETLAVMTVEGRSLAVTVDAAVAVEHLGEIEPLPAGSGLKRDGVVLRLARRRGQDQPVMLVEPDRLLRAVG